MKKRLLALLLIPCTLSACSTSVPLSFNAYTHYVEDLGLGKGFSSVSLPYSSEGKESISSINDVCASRDAKNIFQNKGDLKLLVVPISFKGVEKSQQEEKRILIQNAFFGDKTHNSYYSVSEYYNRSSYGQVRLTGEVSDWYETEMTIQEAINQSKADGAGENVSRKIALSAIDWLHNNTSIDLAQYDVDGDNVVDGIYFIYDYPQDDGTNSVRSQLLWAYFDKVNMNVDGHNTVAPYASSYSWSSFYFTGTNALKSNIVDANTFIHETGHLFGLDDYYNTNGRIVDYNGNYNKELSGVFQPTGFMDMMDYNLGDHNAFSKYLLNWVTPKVINKEETITLKSFTKSGDCLLIPSPEWNGSPFDEYLILEYFTPTGLNDTFSFPSYSYFDGDNNQRVYQSPTRYGLRVYHVDARLAYYQTRTSANPSKCWINDPNLDTWAANNGGRFIDFLNTNATHGTVDKNSQVLVHLLEADGKDNLYNGIAASNTTMFGLHDEFGKNVYKDFEFNKVKSKTTLESELFTFEITALNRDEITIKFEKK